MCCTGSRHNRPTLSHAELMRERERAKKNMPKDDPRRREMGAYRAKANEPRCGDCGQPKPADGLRTCLACRATALLRTRKSQAAAKEKAAAKPGPKKSARKPKAAPPAKPRVRETAPIPVFDYAEAEAQQTRHREETYERRRGLREAA